MNKRYKDTQALEYDIHSSHYCQSGGSTVTDAEGEKYITFGGDMSSCHLDGAVLRLRDGKPMHFSRMAYPVTIEWRDSK